MLALFGTLAALAAPPAVDVLIAPVTAHTHAMRVEHERLDINGQPMLDRFRPEGRGLGYRGLFAEVSWALPRIDHSRLLLSAGANAARPRYDTPTFAFAPDMGEIDLGAGILTYFDDRDPVVDGYALCLLGTQLSWISARPWTRLAVVPMPNAAFALGVGSRTKYRYRAEVRADLGVRVDGFDARMELPHGALIWNWMPVSASLSLVMGVGFG